MMTVNRLFLLRISTKCQQLSERSFFPTCAITGPTFSNKKTVLIVYMFWARKGRRTLDCPEIHLFRFKPLSVSITKCPVTLRKNYLRRRNTGYKCHKCPPHYNPWRGINGNLNTNLQINPIETLILKLQIRLSRTLRDVYISWVCI